MVIVCLLDEFFSDLMSPFVRLSARRHSARFMIDTMPQTINRVINSDAHFHFGSFQ